MRSNPKLTVGSEDCIGTGTSATRQLELDLVDDIPLVWLRHPRARRYRLRVLADGRVRITLPRWGCKREAMVFVERQMAWIRRQRQRVSALGPTTRAWSDGTEILFRGLPVKIRIVGQAPSRVARFADQDASVGIERSDLRPFIEQHLWRLADHELKNRAFELAREQKAPLRKVTVRNQRTRWGSCSVRGTISLNWRLIQLPLSVRDYLIFHELAHLAHMNHSRRFWQHVAAICPWYRESESWLKKHRALLEG
jgi:hypothetical protein